MSSRLTSKKFCSEMQYILNTPYQTRLARLPQASFTPIILAKFLIITSAMYSAVTLIRLKEKSAYSTITATMITTTWGTKKTVESHQKAADFIQKNIATNAIFCGDLNTRPDSKAMGAFEPLGLFNNVVESGIGTTLGKLSRVDVDVVCDYIFSSPSIKIKDFQVIDSFASDHKALILEFSL